MSFKWTFWQPDRLTDAVRDEQAKRLNAAAMTVQAHAKRLLSQAGSGRIRGKKAGPITRSRPGEPPRKQTGILRASVVVDPATRARLVARVGTPLQYGIWLELGTSKMAPRPWLRRAMIERLADVRRIVA